MLPYGPVPGLSTGTAYIPWVNAVRTTKGRSRRHAARTSLFGACAGLLIAGCAHTVNLLDPATPRFSGEYATPATDWAAGPIRIVTFNIKLARRIDPAIEVLRSDSLRGADIIALEEMDDAGVDRIARALGLNYVYYPSSIHPSEHRYFGPAVLSRWPIARSWKLLLPHEARFRHQRRTATAAELLVRGQRVRVYAVHLETPFEGLGCRARGPGEGRARRRGAVRRAGGDRGRLQQLRHRSSSWCDRAIVGSPRGSIRPSRSSPGITSSYGTCRPPSRPAPVWCGGSTARATIAPCGRSWCPMRRAVFRRCFSGIDQRSSHGAGCPFTERMPPKRSASRRSQGWTDWLTRVRAAQLAVGAGLILVGFLFYANLASSERKLEHPIPHRYATADSAVRPHDGEPARPGVRPRQPGQRAPQRRPGVPGDARGHPVGAPDDHLRELHLLVVDDRAAVHRRAVRARPGRRAAHV